MSGRPVCSPSGHFLPTKHTHSHTHTNQMFALLGGGRGWGHGPHLCMAAVGLSVEGAERHPGSMPVAGQGLQRRGGHSLSVDAWAWEPEPRSSLGRHSLPHALPCGLEAASVGHFKPPLLCPPPALGEQGAPCCTDVAGQLGPGGEPQEEPPRLPAKPLPGNILAEQGPSSARRECSGPHSSPPARVWPPGALWVWVQLLPSTPSAGLQRATPQHCEAPAAAEFLAPAQCSASLRPPPCTPPPLTAVASTGFFRAQTPEGGALQRPLAFDWAWWGGSTTPSQPWGGEGRGGGPSGMRL